MLQLKGSMMTKDPWPQQAPAPAPRKDSAPQPVFTDYASI